jgi:hypothetical protein
MTREEAIASLRQLYAQDPDWDRILDLLESHRMDALEGDDWALIVYLIRRGRSVLRTSSLADRLARSGTDGGQPLPAEQDLRKRLL